MTKVISRVCIVSALLFFGLIVLNTSFVSMPLSTFLVLMLTFLCQGCILLLLKKYMRPFRNFGAVLFAFRLVLCIAFIFFTTAEPVQDFLRMYLAGKDIANGVRDYLQDDYFYRFPYQTGFSAYEGLILFLCGGKVMAIKLLNAVYMSVSTLLLYLISRSFVSEKSAMCTGLLYAIYPAPLFLAGVLTNQHLSVMLMLLAVYVLIKEPSPLRFFMSGVLLSLSNTMWPVVIIAVVAGVIYGIYLLFEKCYVKRILGVALLPVGYCVTGIILSVLVVVTGLNPEGLTNNRPNWLFVVGLSEHGSWNKADYDALMFLPEEEVDDAMAEVAIGRVEEYGVSGLLELFDEKITVMWGKFEDMSWGFADKTSDDWTRAKDIMATCEKGVFLFALLLAGVGLFKHFKNPAKTELLPMLIFCGYFAVYLIIEVQSRYRYIPTAAMFCLAALGIEYLGKNKRSTN